MTFSAALPAGSPACVPQLDPELLETGPAGIARCMGRPLFPEETPLDHWAFLLPYAQAHAAALTPAARDALFVVADRLQALRVAEAALEVAGRLLAREMEQEGG